MHAPFLRFSVSVLLACALTFKALACCSVSSPDRRMLIADQRVLIVWDEANKTEHFVRQADFLGESKDFGFLVPSPGIPEIAEFDGKIFDELEEATKPKTVYRPIYKFSWSILGQGQVSVHYNASAGSAVTVLGSFFVAGFQANVLQATSAAALTDWLKANGYALRSEVSEWLEPYIRLQWKITAFKFLGEKKDLDLGGAASTSAIRLSFKTESPLFPYRVPKDELATSNARSQQSGRTPLRMFVIAPSRVDGFLGDRLAAWPAELRFAGPSTISLKNRISKDFKMDEAWLTAFDDHSWPGGTEDLTFKASPTQEAFRRTVYVSETVNVWIPVELIILPVIGIAIFIGLKLRKRAAAPKA